MAADLSMLPPPSQRGSKATARISSAAQERMTIETSDAVTKPPPLRRLRRLPPISDGGAKADRSKANATAGAEPAARAAKAWMRQALAKRVAARMLKRSAAPPPSSSADEQGDGGGGWKVLSCCCARLPPGLRCALHQAGAPGRGWLLRAQQQRHGGGGEGGEAPAVAPPRAHGWAFSEYARWRRHVWMPSRFYLEHVEEHRRIELRCSTEPERCM